MRVPLINLPCMIYIFILRRVEYPLLPEYAPWDSADVAEVLGDEHGWVGHDKGKCYWDCLLHSAAEHFRGRCFGTHINTERPALLLAKLVYLEYP